MSTRKILFAAVVLIAAGIGTPHEEVMREWDEELVSSGTIE